MCRKSVENELKIRISFYNFSLVLFIVYFLNNAFLDGGLVFIQVSESMKVLSGWLDILLLFFGLGLICTGGYTRREVEVIVLGYLLTAVVSVTSKRFGLLYTWSFLVLAKQIPYRKWIKAAFGCCVIILMTGVVATISGYYQDDISNYRSVLGIRYTFGLTHPNMAGNYLVEIGMGYMWLKGKSVRGRDFLLFIIITAVCFIYPNSIGSSFVLAVFICVLWALRYGGFSKEGKRKFLFFLYYTAIAFVILDFSLALINVADVPILSTIDAVSSRRFSEMHRFFHHHGGFSIWGREYDLTLLNQSAYRGREAKYYADCGWVFMSMSYGLVFELFFLYFYFSTMRFFAIRGKEVNMVIFFCMALYEMEQTVFPFLGMNFFLILMAERIFPGREGLLLRGCLIKNG